MLKKIQSTLLTTAVTVAVVGVTAYVLRESAKATIDKAADIDLSKVDPLNPNNLINEYFTKGYQLVTGSTQSLGADVYDLLHPKAEPPKPRSVYDTNWTLESNH